MDKRDWSLNPASKDWHNSKLNLTLKNQDFKNFTTSNSFLFNNYNANNLINGVNAISTMDNNKNAINGS